MYIFQYERNTGIIINQIFQGSLHVLRHDILE